VSGYSRAIFSGFTTIELARIIHTIIANYPDAHGLYHVSSEPISKYDLLCLIRYRFDLDVQVVSDDNLVIDRSLDSTRFRQSFDYHPPLWETMVAELEREQPKPIA
jgi:dTDP-4-dehydrorhamnose reductase